MFMPKLPQQEQGFTLVEVLIAMLLATTFVIVAMQMMVVATLFKERARQVTEAKNWIQRELENAKSLVTVDKLPHVYDDISTTNVNEEAQKCGTDATSTTSNGYAEALRTRLPALNTAKTANIGSQTFIAVSNTANEPNPRTVGGAKLWLLRNTTNATTAPYNILRISYAVVRDSNNSPSNSSVATLYSEMIPDAVSQCP